MNPRRRRQLQLLRDEALTEYRKTGPTPQEVWARNNNITLPQKEEVVEEVKEEPKKVFNFQKKKKQDG